jgi:hypothetical protein
MINARTSLSGALKTNKILVKRLKSDDTMKSLVTNLGCYGIAWTILTPVYDPVMRMEILHVFHADRRILVTAGRSRRGLFHGSYFSVCPAVLY